MKKLLTILGLLVLFAGVLRAQDCPFNVKYNVIAATCHNNGKIAYALTDNSGNVYTTLPAELTDVRMYYKVSATDSAHYNNHYYTGGWDTMVVAPQEYNTIGVEGLCTGTSGPQMLHKEFKNVRVNGSYTPLTASYRLVDGSTKVNTLECLEAGAVYVAANYGRFPYKVIAEDAITQVTIRNISTSRDRELILDSLPSGIYNIKVEDACRTTVSLGNVEIEAMPVPQLKYVGVPSTTFSSRDVVVIPPSDSNIVRLAIVFENSEKDIFKQMKMVAEYRFTYDGLPANAWRPLEYRTTFQDENISADDRKVYAANIFDVRDTVFSVSKYSELWGKDITFEYRLNSCGTQTFTHTFQLLPPNKEKFNIVNSSYKPSTHNVINGCNIIADSIISHSFSTYDNFYTGQSYSRNLQYISMKYNIDSIHNYSRHYYTLPVVITYSDSLTGYLIKRDILKFPLGYYTCGDLYDTTLRRVYGIAPDEEKKISYKVRIEDAKGCELWEDFGVYNIKSSIKEYPIPFKFYFNPNSVKSCNGSTNSIIIDNDGPISEKFKFPNGTKIRIVKSPRNNFYNFEATWDSLNQELIINKSNPNNLIEIYVDTAGSYYANYERITLRSQYSADDDSSEFTSTPYDRALSPGIYKAEVEMPNCEIYETTGRNYLKIRRSEIIDSPKFEVNKECSFSTVTLKSGQGRIYEYSYINDTVLYIDTIEQLMSIRISKGPSGTYETKTAGLNEPIEIYGQGMYILTFSTPECMKNIYDTIYIDNSPIFFEESSAILCDTTSTSGDVLLAVSNGVEPLTYELHSGNDITGPLLGTNNDGIFRNLPMTLDSVFTAKVTDDCGHSIIVNIHPLALSNTRKAWFDGGLDSTAICEGNTIGINALGKGVLYHYTWTGPNGFVSNSHKSTVVVNKGSESGWYKVEISNTGCPYPIVDSIYLTVLKSPYVEVTQGIAECFENDTIVNFTAVSPNNSNNIYFNYVYADNTNKRLDGKNNVRLSNGETLSDTVKNLPDFSKVYFLQVKDGVCTSSSPTDTFTISAITPVPVTITVECPAGVMETVNLGECNFKVEETTLDEPTATHSLGWALEIKCLLPSDSTLPAGENTVMWIATDRCGNADTCTQKVTVTFPECPSVTDADGNTYESVRIGCDCWMQRNLETSTYADNTPISWAKGYESFMHPDADANIAVFGRLYDFASAVNDSADNGHGHVQGACPDGWHLPTPAQYSALLGMDATTLKTSEYWIDGGGNNSTGFAWLPAGRYNGSTTRFEGLLASSWFWSVDGTGENLKVYSFCTRYSCDTVMEDSPANGSAYSIRCVKEKK